ncbi:hypothetical protein [Streptomyces sp. NBC_01508]|uniref:hypothetical protein n=1 Tax=Streptomyces sp. NBC_01508 TaxID=2903888 RepID=UPI003864BD35
MAVEYSKLYAPLLEWVYEQAEGHPQADVDLGPFAVEHGLEEREGFDLLTYGKSKGGLDDRFATLGTPAANLTPYGLDLVEESLKRRASPVARSKAARQSLLRWLWAQKDQSVHFPIIDGFVGTLEATFEGDELTLEEVDRAAGYLSDKGLIKGTKVMGRMGPVRAEITAEGQDCVENYDGDPSAQDRRGLVGATYNTYLPNAQGVIVGEQQNFTQNNSSGVDPSAFIQLAGYVGQISATLGMDGPQRVELERVAQELHDEASSETPEQGRLRHLAGQVKERLTAAGATMAATVGVQMAEQAIGSLM